MCGRYVLAVDPEALQTAFNLTSVPDFSRFNIAPTQFNPVITNEHPSSAELLRWGLIPSWCKDAIAHQRARQLGSRETVVPHRIQTPPLPDSGDGILRMDTA